MVAPAATGVFKIALIANLTVVCFRLAFLWKKKKTHKGRGDQLHYSCEPIISFELRWKKMIFYKIVIFIKKKKKGEKKFINRRT